MNTGYPAARNRSELPFAADVYREETADTETDLDVLRTELRTEVRALRSLVSRSTSAPPPKELTNELASIRAALDELAPAPKKDRASTLVRTRGVEGSAATRLLSGMKRAKGEDLASKARVALEGIVEIGPSPIDGGRRIVAVVGPAGVGKTTTIAKLAARARVEGKTVALVTCDAFRVGAVDQLEEWAELLDASFQVASSALELRAAIAEEDDADVIFVDTSGRPPSAASPEAVIGAMARDVSPDRDRTVEVILCLPATIRAVDAARVVQKYEIAAPTAICVTKADETDMPAGLVHGPFAAKRPLCLVGTGPRVPEDLENPTHDMIADLVLGQETDQ